MLDRNKSDTGPTFIHRVLWGCEHNLIVIAVLAILTFVCAAGVFNQLGRPIQIDGLFASAMPTATPSPDATQHIALARTNVGQLLIIDQAGKQTSATLHDIVNGHSITSTRITSAETMPDVGAVLFYDRSRMAVVSEQNGFQQVSVAVSGTLGVRVVPFTQTVQQLPGPVGIVTTTISITLRIPANTPLSWSTLGSRLAFIAEGATAQGQKVSALYAVTMAPELTPTLITTFEGDILSPVWIDDEWLAYVQAAADRPEQVVIRSTTVITEARIIYPPTP